MMAEVKVKSNKNWNKVVKYNGILSIILIVGYFISSLSHLDYYSTNANAIAYFFVRFGGLTLSTIVGVGIYYGTKNTSSSKKAYVIALLIVNCLSNILALIMNGAGLIEGTEPTVFSNPHGPNAPQLFSLPWILWSVNVFIPILILFADKIFAPFKEK